MKRNRGLTLIEILVVMSIITLASGVIFGNLKDARARARDEERIRNIHEIRNALGLYLNDNGHYPCISNALSNSNNATTKARWNDNLANELSPYIPKLPSDPLGKFYKPNFVYAIAVGVYSYSYTTYDYLGNGRCMDYDLIAHLETNHSLKCSNQSSPYATKWPYTNRWYESGKSYYYCNCLSLVDTTHGCWLYGQDIYQDH
jgi:type II secretion system protein G